MLQIKRLICRLKLRGSIMKTVAIAASFALMCGSAVAQSHPADFISVTVTQVTPAAADTFARILFEVTNKGPVTYSRVIFECSAFDADKKLMGVSAASVGNLGPEVTEGVSKRRIW
jgi:hypothetical protein